MTRYLFFFLLIAALSHQKAVAQKHVTLSGYVNDAKTGETLIGATITVKEKQEIGTTTNAYGFYSITLPEGNYQITVRYMGYIP